jgi:hypothetical protein
MNYIYCKIANNRAPNYKQDWYKNGNHCVSFLHRFKFKSLIIYPYVNFINMHTSDCRTIKGPFYVSENYLLVWSSW